MLNANKNISNAASVADLTIVLEIDFDMDNVEDANLISGLLAIEANKTQLRKKKV